MPEVRRFTQGQYVRVNDLQSGLSVPNGQVCHVVYADGYWVDIESPTRGGMSYSAGEARRYLTPATAEDFANQEFPPMIVSCGVMQTDSYGRHCRYRYERGFDPEIREYVERRGVEYLDANGNVIPEPARPEMRQCRQCGVRLRTDQHYRGRNVTCNQCLETRRENRERIAQDGRRFGVELEFVAEVDREGAYGTYGAMLDRHTIIRALEDAGLPVYDTEYSHEVMDREWKLVHDASVDDGYELVSPPLRWADRKQVSTACEVLRDLGCTSGQHCGLHVHHEVADLSLSNLKRVIANWATAQPMTNTLVNPNRRDGNSQWCQPWTAQDVARVRRSANIAQLTQADRYMSLNVTCYRSYGTFEIRQHHSTLDDAEILAWVAYGQAFIEHAARRRNVSKPRAADPAGSGYRSHSLDPECAAEHIDRLPICDDAMKDVLKRKARDAAPGCTTATPTGNRYDDAW